MWEYLLVGGFIASLIHGGRKSAEREAERREEDRRRRNTPCNFVDGFSKEDFERIAYKSGKHIKRLIKTRVEGPVVYGTVRAQSGLSEWEFRVDFNDYGHITGKYWLYSDNDDSNIPEHFADNIKQVIKAGPEAFHAENGGNLNRNRASHDSSKHICPICGSILNNQPGYADWNVAFTCKKCGHYSEWANDEENGEPDKTSSTQDDREQAFTSATFTDYIHKPKKSLKQRIKAILIGLGIAAIIALACVVGVFADSLINGIALETDNKVISNIDYKKLEEELKEKGFWFVSVESVADLDYENASQKNTVAMIYVNDKNDFESDDEFSRFANIKIVYHTVKKVKTPISAKDAKGEDYVQIAEQFKEAGFGNIELEADYDVILGWINSTGEIEKITIDGYDNFSEGSTYSADAIIYIIYHEKSSLKPE